MSATLQECHAVSCRRPAAFTTRTRPAWCDEHIDEILNRGGLEPLEPFSKPTAWRLTRCTACGCEAHYRFDYTLEQNQVGQTTCRACFYRTWALAARAAQGPFAQAEGVAEEEARAHADAHGYIYLEALTSPSLVHDPHRVECRYCGRVRAARLGDIGFGCSCQSNPRRSAQTSNVSGPRGGDLLKDCGQPVLDWWDDDRNDVATWDTATVRARRKAHWRCPACGGRFVAQINEMVGSPQCPDCMSKRREIHEAELDRYRTTPVSAVPELLEAWADDGDPSTTMVAADNSLRRFRCTKGHNPRLTILSFLRQGCPVCRGAATRAKRLDAVHADPEAHGMNAEIAGQWHPQANGRVRLETVSAHSRRTFWWREPSCGHEWQQTPADREKGQRLRCPECRTILDSLGYHYPKLTAEWSPNNPLTAWQVRPSAGTAFIPVWTCATKPNHEWRAALASRSAGSGCPECREHGKSKVELLHLEATERMFGNAASGRAIRSDAFQRQDRWLVDIITTLSRSVELIIEYDGAYWHSDKTEVDTEKSLDLLAAGYWVARLREFPLPGLPVQHERYQEFVVHSAAPDSDRTLKKVSAWLARKSVIALPSNSTD